MQSQYDLSVENQLSLLNKESLKQGFLEELPLLISQQKNKLLLNHQISLFYKVHAQQRSVIIQNCFSMALNETLAQNDYHVALLQDKENMPHQEKQQLIKNVKSSIAVEKTTSFRTITSITNTMIGSSILVYPTLFIQDGLLSSLFMMLVVGIVQYWTCRILCLHNKPGEADVNQTILRILGPKWYKANLMTNVLLLYIVCIVYFLLIGQNFYSLTSEIASLISNTYVPPPANKLVFDTYSSQWAGLAIMVVCGSSLFVKKMELLLKFLKYTAYAVFTYMIFIAIFAIKYMATKTVQWDEYVLFSADFSNVAGAFALSFIIHPVVSPLLKKNMDQSKNNRDLFLGYVLTASVYAFVGIIGAFACGGYVKQVMELNFQTIFECFPQEKGYISFDYVFSKIVQAGVLLQNMSVFPVLSFLTRKQFLEIVDKNKPSPKVSLAFTISLIILSLVIHIFNINVTVVISFDGAIIGFVLAYLIPIYMHLYCVYHKFTQSQNQKRYSLIYSSDDLSNASLTDPSMLNCVHKTKPNKTRDIILYSILGLFGVAMGLFKIYSFIRS